MSSLPWSRDETRVGSAEGPSGLDWDLREMGERPPKGLAGELKPASETQTVRMEGAQGA